MLITYTMSLWHSWKYGVGSSTGTGSVIKMTAYLCECNNAYAY